MLFVLAPGCHCCVTVACAALIRAILLALRASRAAALRYYAKMPRYDFFFFAAARCCAIEREKAMAMPRRYVAIQLRVTMLLCATICYVTLRAMLRHEASCYQLRQLLSDSLIFDAC